MKQLWLAALAVLMISCNEDEIQTTEATLTESLEERPVAPESIDPCGENLISAPNAFDDPFWNPYFALLEANIRNITSPLGERDVDRLIDNSSSQGGAFMHDFNTDDLNDGGVFEFNIYLKSETSPATQVLLWYPPNEMGVDKKNVAASYEWLTGNLRTRSHIGTHKLEATVEQGKNDWMLFTMRTKIFRSEGETLRLQIQPAICPVNESEECGAPAEPFGGSQTENGAIYVWGASLRECKE